MNRSIFHMIMYMNGSIFLKTRYMNGIGFEILARTPVPQLPPLPHPRVNSIHFFFFFFFFLKDCPIQPVNNIISLPFVDKILSRKERSFRERNVPFADSYTEAKRDKS